MKLFQAAASITAIVMTFAPMAIVAESASAATSFGRYIVTFKDGVKSKNKVDVSAVGGSTIAEIGLINGLVVTVPNEAAAKRLKNIDGVKTVEEDAVAYASAAPSRAVQPPQQTPWGISKINADDVWTTNRGQGIDVAVLDTGIDGSHSDLKANVKGGINFVSLRKQTNWADDNGHGTHVSGTIAAANNTVGVVGVAPEANLYAVKVLDRSGSGSISSIISGIDWAVANGMEVINMSLGTSSDIQAFHDAVDRAAAAGVVIVAAAGNSGDASSATNNVEYPARYSSVIAVAATDSSNVRSYFSSDGPEVAVSAPGVSITSTTKGGGYGVMSGTSMASPHVAGLVSVMLSANIPASQIRAQLIATADDLGAVGFDTFYGNGLVDAPEAVLNAVI